MVYSGKVLFANVGDSRALLLGSSTVKQVTRDHKPDDKDEKIRIVRNGGKVYKDGYMQNRDSVKIFNNSRIFPGSLNISRTIGDIEAKVKKYGGLPGVIIPEP
jgi:serine/threonine protein phosphatase PrpC